ncbi:hypothetical protein OIU74_022578 [Salix koriyanagi]|uniref:Uncharacterized protein n=1 Tax=Salix koriyanagi TaxID=2511006 RepID=A0A9Q0WM49_9ROSI|nr:hypothetical protein OIU74_022578 [Salix koriyanagi]
MSRKQQLESVAARYVKTSSRLAMRSPQWVGSTVKENGFFNGCFRGGMEWDPGGKLGRLVGQGGGSTIGGGGGG